jgi:sigma-B regulation protein RsbU (phosphoserine phosphatase)
MLDLHPDPSVPDLTAPSGLDEAPHILVVEDDPLMRSFLEAVLVSLGYVVAVAADGRQALDRLAKGDINLVITDWMMPDIDGLELCRRVRAQQSARYTYIILLTGREDGSALVEGMEAGADDFVTKPPDIDELRVRLAAGQRVLRLERQLERRNQTLAAANGQLREAYDRIERDLAAAAAAQRRMLPQPRDLGGLRYDWLFLPSSHVAGDTFNVLSRNGHVAFYQIDVAGHGVPAALLSVSLQRALSGSGFGLAGDEAGSKGLWRDPVRLVAELNRCFQAEDIDDASYFTLVYGVLDLQSGDVVLTQAGHPPPLLVAQDGAVAAIGEGGFMVGLLPDVDYEAVRLQLGPGERLWLYSDGVVECRNRQDQLFGQERLVQLAANTHRLPIDASLRMLEQRLQEWSEEMTFEDDVSVLIIERDAEAAQGGPR